jgi:hypothetical protein
MCMLLGCVAQAAPEDLWDVWLDAWLTAKLQPKLDCLLAIDNAALRDKVTELRPYSHCLPDTLPLTQHPLRSPASAMLTWRP